MASSEPNTFEESLTATNRANMPTENTPTTTQAETEAAERPAVEPQRSASYRAVRLSQSEGTGEGQQQDIDPWWSEVENNDFVLDQVPNVTAVFTPTPEAILEKSISVAESENVLKEENFDRLHKIADRIKMTLSEHAKNKEIEEQAERERKLSEESDKENKTGCNEIDFCGSVETHKEQTLEEFKEELRVKRLQRQNAVQSMRDEIATLRRQLELERDLNRRLRRGGHVEEKCSLSSSESDEATSLLEEGAYSLANTNIALSDDDQDPLSRSRHANIELANAQLALQMANAENISLRGELAVVQKQVVTLKEVIACCKQMLAVKEEQCNELKQRLTEIEKSFAEREMKIMSENLRQEYERQLVNIRQLKQLYEERQRVAAAEYENLQRLISIKRDELAQEQEKSKTLEERNQSMMKEIDIANNELACLRDEVKEHKFEKAALKEEIGAVNTLFSQMVVGFSGKNNLDIDKLTTMLEENRKLLNDMATKEFTDGATLPKLLFELVQQASTTQDDSNENATASVPLRLNSASLPKPPSKDKTGTDLLAKHQADGADVDLNEGSENGDVSVSENDNDYENVESSALNVRQKQVDEGVPVLNEKTSASNVQTTANNGEDDALPSISGEKTFDAAPTKVKKYHRKATTNNKRNIFSTSTASAETIQFHDSELIGKVASTQEIIVNLPKVWRVLMELLSHHKIDPVQFEENGKGEDCFKSVETPNGPKAEISVSKTYMKLKNLIVEKKQLIKETNRLKTLNSHLDYRLNEQEKRLSAVSLELTKTWHLVGKMQRQHRQLHTQEQILRYQLQQKRRLLSELKDELEYCRRKWAAARAKNDESQEQCDDLRREFARRKLEDASNSAESGYSDSGGPVSDEEITVPVDVIIGAVEEEMGENIENDLDEDDDGSLVTSKAAGGCVNYRRKRLREMFEHTRKIKRMQSTSPGRAANVPQQEVVVLRWNSAPPTCGWRETGGTDDDNTNELDGEINKASFSSSLNRGAIPKTRLSRRVSRSSTNKPEVDKNEENKIFDDVPPEDERACRIQRLEEQCKTLIKQVLETSDNRERLEIQLKRFQDEVSPVQYDIPMEEFLNKKRFERMTRASSVPITGTGCLTPREEEYTRKRSERLERLEEESRQLMSRIKRTSDRGHYLRCSLDRLRRAPVSRDGSFESNTEDEYCKPDEDDDHLSGTEINANDNSQSNDTKFSSIKIKPNLSPLTAEEEAYTARRTARLQRLEEESKYLMSKLSKNNQRGDAIGNKLDNLHKRYKSQKEEPSFNSCKTLNFSYASAVTGQMSVEQRIENIEKISSNREERLRILEEEGRQLINKLSETSEKGTQMINKIAERELSRQKRCSSTPTRDNSDNNERGISAKVTNAKSTSEETPVATALLPTPKTVACSSIVFEELTDRVTITTTPSQIAAHQGAIPKYKPTLQLLAARPKSARLQKNENKTTGSSDESLEEMVKRLKSLPFPSKETPIKQEAVEEKEKQKELKSETTTVNHNVENPTQIKEIPALGNEELNKLDSCVVAKEATSIIETPKQGEENADKY